MVVKPLSWLYGTWNKLVWVDLCLLRYHLAVVQHNYPVPCLCLNVKGNIEKNMPFDGIGGTLLAKRITASGKGEGHLFCRICPCYLRCPPLRWEVLLHSCLRASPGKDPAYYLRNKICGSPPYEAKVHQCLSKGIFGLWVTTVARAGMVEVKRTFCIACSFAWKYCGVSRRRSCSAS